MKIALVTTTDLKCGLADYARNLMTLLPEVEWTVAGHQSIFMDLRGKKFDIVHVNYEPGPFPIHNVEFALKFGKRSVLTLHTSTANDNRSALTEMFDATVIHEKSVNISETTGKRFVHIPMGIPQPLSEAELMRHKALNHLPPFDIGSAGFPFPQKGFPDVAAAAYALKMSCALVMAEYPGHDFRPLENACRVQCPERLTTVTTWLPERNVIAFLNNCRVNVFAYNGANAGISGAVRMGLAAGNPLLLTRCRMFCDLFEYEDEIEFVDAPAAKDIADGIERLLKNGKRPKRVVEDMSWRKSADKYLKVYQSLIS